MRPTKERGSRALPALFALGLIAALFLVFFRQGLAVEPLSVATSYDLHSAFLPKFTYGNEEILAGRLPTWNPYEHVGIPFLATTQASVFYPPKIVLFALFDTETAYYAFMVLHFAALALGFLFFLREQGITGTGALIGAAMWTFGFPILMSNYHPPRIANLVWMPFLFVFTERVVRGQGRHSVAWLALVVALQLSAGYPEFTLDTAVLVAVHSVAGWALGAWTAPPWKTLPLVAGAFLLGAVILAVQLAPLAEIAMVARRVDVANVDRFAPEAGGLGTRAAAVAGLFPGLVLFPVLGLFMRRGRAAMVSLAAATLVSTGGWLLLARLPGFGMVRFPWVWMLVSCFPFAWLAAAGADALGADGAMKRRERVATAIIALGGITWAALCAYFWQRDEREVAEFGPALSQLARNVRSPVPLTLGILGGLGLAAAVLTRLSRPVPVVGLAVPIVALTLGHLAGYPFGARPAPVRPSAERSAVEALRDAPLEGRVLSLPDVREGRNMTARVPSVFGSEISLLPWRQRTIIESLGVVTIVGYASWRSVAAARGYLDAANVQFVEVPPEAEREFLGSGLRRVGARPGAVVLANDDRMGAAWVSHGVRIAASADDARTHVLGAGFDPHHEVVLEAPTAFVHPPRGSEPTAPPATVERRSPTELFVRARLERPGVMVFSQSVYPGWEAFVDDRPQALLNANYVMSAVELPAGPHEVRVVYRPRPARWGAVASVLGILVLGGLFCRAPLARILRRSGPTHDPGRRSKDQP